MSGIARPSVKARSLSGLGTTLVVVATLGLAGGALPGPSRADPTRDIQEVGLPPLYEALFAVANCPNVALDEPAFRRAARLYRLSTDDLTIEGPFSAEIAQLASDYRVRLEDDHDAFCSAARLSFAVPHGILVDRGPVVPHPLPFAIAPY